MMLELFAGTMWCVLSDCPWTGPLEACAWFPSDLTLYLAFAEFELDLLSSQIMAMSTIWVAVWMPLKHRTVGALGDPGTQTVIISYKMLGKPIHLYVSVAEEERIITTDLDADDWPLVLGGFRFAVSWIILNEFQFYCGHHEDPHIPLFINPRLLKVNQTRL